MSNVSETNDFLEDLKDKFEFIWGVKSYDDITGREKADLYTMNDIDLIYDKEEKKYFLSIETIYEMNLSEQKIYIKNLYDEFLKFMNENNYSTNKKLNYMDVFTEEKISLTKLDSIEEAFAYFKFIACAFYLGIGGDQWNL